MRRSRGVPHVTTENVSKNAFRQYLHLMHVHQLPQVHLPPPLGVLLRAVALAVVVPGPVPVDRHSRAQAVVHATLAGGTAYRQVLGAHVQAGHQLRVCSVQFFHRKESGLEETVVGAFKEEGGGEGWGDWWTARLPRLTNKLISSRPCYARPPAPLPLATPSI